MKIFKVIIFSLILMILLVVSAKAKMYYPSDDKTCWSNGLNWSDGGNCSDYFQSYNGVVYLGQDGIVWNDEGRSIFKFDYNLPSNSIVENATFCAYIFYGLCHQNGPYYMCDVGDTYASHIYIPGNIGVAEYNSSILGSEKLWLSNQGLNAPIGGGKYWCINVTDWVIDDSSNNRTSTSIRLNISSHHALSDSYASQVRIYSRLNSTISVIPYLDINYSTVNLTLEERVAALENNVNILMNQTQNNSDRIGVLEEIVNNILNLISSIHQVFNSF